MAQRMGEALSVGSTDSSRLLPRDILVALLRPPFCFQRLWLLARDGLFWLVSQARCFQVMLAAHRPQLFRHLMAEGLAPELFFCWWLQCLFESVAPEPVLLRLWDIFVFERSYKVFVRVAVAIFGALEHQLMRVGDAEKMLRLLKDEQAWML